MSGYPFSDNTRVAVCSMFSDWAEPTVAELNAGSDITCELTVGGLSIAKTTLEIDRTLWAGDMTSTSPTRYGFSSPSLTAFRARPGQTEALYDLAVFRSRHFLAVRYGVPFDTDWADGQPLEVIYFRFGKRSTVPSDEGAVLFTVPLFVIRAIDDGDAEVAA